MKKLILICSLFLAGCSSVPLSAKIRTVPVGIKQSTILREFGEPDSFFKYKGKPIWAYYSGASTCFVEFENDLVSEEPFCKYDAAEAARINANNAAIWQNVGNAVSVSGQNSASQYYQDYSQSQSKPMSPSRNCLGKVKPYSTGCQFKCINDDWVSICE